MIRESCGSGWQFCCERRTALERTIPGFGTAGPKSKENYFNKTIRTRHGKAMIVMRGDGELTSEVQ